MNQVNKNKIRNSSIELLRIISMFFIIFDHYLVHGGFSHVIDEMNFSSTYLSCIALFGKTSCFIFSLITGYYMVLNKDKYLIQFKRFIKLLCQFLFYSLGALLFLLKCFDFFQNDSHLVFDGNSIVKCLLPIIYGNWYFKTYLYFVIFIPFINTIINSLDKTKHMVLLCVIFLIWFIIQNSTALGSLSDHLLMMLVMYFIGSYIRKYKNGLKNSPNKYFVIGLISALLMILIEVFYHIDVTNKYLLLLENTFKSFNIVSAFNKILSYIVAINMFMFFSSYNFRNRVIDTIASTTLGIYLIHDNDYFRYLIWVVLSPNELHYNNPIFHSIAKTLIVFIVCFVIDLLRQKTIAKIVNKIIDEKYDELILKKNE